MTDFAAFLADLRARHATNAEHLDKLDTSIAALKSRFEDQLAELQQDRAAVNAAFETSAGILEAAEKLTGFSPVPGTTTVLARADGGGGSGGNGAEPPTGRAKRGEIGGLILGMLREVPIAGMTEAEILAALPQHKPGSVTAALKNAAKKKDVEEKDGRFFVPDSGKAAQAAPQPIAAPTAAPASPPVGGPDALAERNIVNAIKSGPKNLDSLLDRCIALGSTADAAKAALVDMIERNVVQADDNGLYDFVAPVGTGASA